MNRGRGEVKDTVVMPAVLMLSDKPEEEAHS
jgi:hypothetical protein